MRRQQEPASPFITSINNREDFNELINPDSDEEDQQANDQLKASMPQGLT